LVFGRFGLIWYSGWYSLAGSSHGSGQTQLFLPARLSLQVKDEFPQLGNLVLHLDSGIMGAAVGLIFRSSAAAAVCDRQASQPAAAAALNPRVMAMSLLYSLLAQPNNLASSLLHHAACFPSCSKVFN
jgi:hypothetical protein